MKADEILDCVRELFDVVGITGSCLILGLESRVDRDLDTFAWDEEKGEWRFPGFYQYFGSKVDVAIQRLKERGVPAKQRRYGDLNIKELAVKAGIGKWGKNSLAIHEKFGPWLRFVVVELGIVFYPYPSDEAEVSHISYSGCRNCNRCLKTCPVNNLLEPFRLTFKEKCLSYVQLEIPTISPASTLLRRCDRCLTACKPQSRR